MTDLNLCQPLLLHQSGRQVRLPSPFQCSPVQTPDLSVPRQFTLPKWELTQRHQLFCVLKEPLGAAHPFHICTLYTKAVLRYLCSCFCVLISCMLTLCMLTSCAPTAAVEDAIFSYLHNKKLLFSRHAGFVCLDVESHVYNTRVVCVHACLVHCIHGGNSLHHQSYGGHAPLQTYFETFRFPIRRRQSQ